MALPSPAVAPTAIQNAPLTIQTFAALYPVVQNGTLSTVTSIDGHKALSYAANS